MTPKISIVICTYNRANLLGECLKSIMKQTSKSDGYEVVVIDDRSTDQTPIVVKSFQHEFSSNLFQYIVDDRKGLSASRNLGYQYAHGKYVAYLDDDVRIPKNWLSNAMYIISKYRNSLIALGGPEKPFFAGGKKPDWFKAKYAVMSKKILGSQERYLKKGESLTGSNMIIKKNTLMEIGGFDERLGMKGKNLYLHEETDLFYRLFEYTNNTAKIFYSPKLSVFHEVSDKKQTLSYILQRSYAGGCAWFDMQNRRKAHLSQIMSVFLAAGYVFIHIVYSGVTFVTYPRWQNWVAERLSKIVFGLGYIANGLHFRIRIKQIR